MKTIEVAIIGGGPAGLMAAETLAKAGLSVTIYDRKPSVGRKFLMAGRGGLNLTHSEPMEKFKRRYGDTEDFMLPFINQFTPDELRHWAEALGETTFIGSSGRIFPQSFKASPLLRAWLKRLELLGVKFRLQKSWAGWNEKQELVFRTPDEIIQSTKPDYTLLALGGASWPSLGSDGSWVDILEAVGIKITPLEPANCGFHLNWSDIFKNKFTGQPLKSIALTFEEKTVPGEIMISENGIEGGAIYALSSRLRRSLKLGKDTTLTIDLRPTLSLEQVKEKLLQPRHKQSLSTYLERILSLSPLEINLLREFDLKIGDYETDELAALIKAIPIRVRRTYSIDKAISSAGGVRLDELDNNLMLKKISGVFIAGEMIDWEAPTGGYLLQGCFATGHAAALGIINYARRS